MNRKIVVSSLLNRMRIGIVEDGRLVEYYLEHDEEEHLQGNVYKGRVENILPGMEAAFVDIGIDRNAFLFLPDLKSEKERAKLKVGDSLMVQVAKEGDGGKGPRITPDIGLPGRYLVLMPGQNQTGVSRRIGQEEERARLKELVEDLRPESMGLIVRTVAEGCSKEELETDLQELLAVWERIETRYVKAPAPSLLYRDYNLIHRIMRDQVEAAGTEIIVDSIELERQVRSELAEMGFTEPNAVQLYTGTLDVFKHFGLQRDLERALGRKVWLDCGAYLIFDETEALLSIDVNTGKYVGKEGLQQTALRTNLEAAAEIARQLRLRNVGGIIIIDFIDMHKEENRRAVLEQLATSLEADRTRTRLLGFTNLGLVELTRKKNRKPLSHMLQMDCPKCHGTGSVVSDETLAVEVVSDIRTLAREQAEEAFLVICHSAVVAQIVGPEGVNLKRLEQETGKKIFVRGDDTYPRDSFSLRAGGSRELERESHPVQVGERFPLTIVDAHAKNKNNGIGRVNGFVIECLHCASRIGQTVEVEVIEVHRTSALARLWEGNSAD
ncbi:MAG: Rne/Rng family ribonuclease [Bacillota bacterium]|nr:Rne/Rng family ribonuclease [Bacillota bacterium]